MQTETVKLSELNEHPAQMRTVLDPEGMASLVLQVYTRGLDQHQPVVVAQSGSGRNVVSGHRRWLARLLAYELGERSAEMTEGDEDRDGREVNLELAREVVNTWAEKEGGLMAAYAPLSGKYGDRDITVALFEGSQKAEILALQSANFSQETPDMLGQARSFQAAVEAGATPAEIARNVGQSEHYTLNHLALVALPENLQELIVDGTLGMGIARPIADLPEDKRSGLAAIVAARSKQDPPPTVKAVKAAARRLQEWSGIQVPMMVKDAATRNRARILRALWAQVAASDKALRAWGVVADAAYQGVLGEPWSDPRVCTAWIAALAPENPYVVDAKAQWPRLMAALAPEAGCATCPVGKLPVERLSQDLDHPCRKSEGVGEYPACIHAIGEHDPVLVEVPMAWAGLPGVSDERPPVCKKFEDLETAWQAQADREQEDGTGLSTSGGEAAAPATESRPVQAAAGAPQDIKGEAKASGPRPVDQHRALIRSFMQRHPELDTTHPWATTCVVCQHKRDDSPVKSDPSAPPCQWAVRSKEVEFLVRIPVDGNGPEIPLCRQFMPKDIPFSDWLVPHPTTPSLPRDWMLEQIQALVKDADSSYQRHGKPRTMMEFMTGRPMEAKNDYKGWFLDELKKQSGDLSHEQVQTLFVWVTSEWRRVKGRRGGGYPLPVGGTGVQFVLYKEIKWTERFKRVYVQGK